jgi:hypothetical protein
VFHCSRIIGYYLQIVLKDKGAKRDREGKKESKPARPPTGNQTAVRGPPASFPTTPPDGIGREEGNNPHLKT